MTIKNNGRMGRPAPSNFEMAIYTISRKEIESFDHTGILAYLSAMKKDAVRNEGKLNIQVDGYNRDKRELCEIEEVRKYIVHLDTCFPHWFYFCYRGNVRYSPYYLLFSMLVPHKVVSKNPHRVAVDIGPGGLGSFMEEQFVRLNALTDELGLSWAENERISKEVADCIFGLFGMRG